MIILFFAALLVSLSPAHAAPAPMPARLLLIESPGEAFSPAQAQEVSDAAQDALDWWAALAPEPVPVVITEERTITADDPFRDLAWLDPYLVDDDPGLTIVIVANARRRLVFANRFAGWALPTPRVVGAVAASVSGLPATLAHELGHALYGLPDRYRTPGACYHPDIMCQPAAAYRARVVGCASLASLGAPCTRVALPRIHAP